jgi:hypothetical protein
MMPIPEVRNLLAWLAGLIVLLAAAPVFAQKESSKKSGREGLTIDPATMMQPWKADLEGMIARGMIRVLTVPNKNTYFQDRGRHRGATYDAFRLMEQDLNAKLERENKLKHKLSHGAFHFHCSTARPIAARARRRKGRYRRGQPHRYPRAPAARGLCGSDTQRCARSRAYRA